MNSLTVFIITGINQLRFVVWIMCLKCTPHLRQNVRVFTVSGWSLQLLCLLTPLVRLSKHLTFLKEVWNNILLKCYTASHEVNDAAHLIK